MLFVNRIQIKPVAQNEGASVSCLGLISFEPPHAPTMHLEQESIKPDGCKRRNLSHFGNEHFVSKYRVHIRWMIHRTNSACLPSLGRNAIYVLEVQVNTVLHGDEAGILHKTREGICGL